MTGDLKICDTTTGFKKKRRKKKTEKQIFPDTVEAVEACKSTRKSTVIAIGVHKGIL